VGLKEPQSAYSCAVVWLLEEAEEGKFKWSTLSVPGVAPMVYGHHTFVAAPQPTGEGSSSSFPWGAELSLILSGGVSDGVGADGLGTVLYLTLNGDAGLGQGWQTFEEVMWRPPPPQAHHVLRVTLAPSRMVVLGGKLIQDKGTIGALGSRVWSLLDDDTVERPIADPAWAFFKARGAPPTVQALKSAGLSATERDSQYLATLPHWAATSGSVEILEYLVKELQMSLDMRDRYGQTPLHVACAVGTEPAVALHLIEAGVNIHRTDFLGGWTPLHAAARGGDAITAEALCSRGVDLNAIADDGSTALHRACAWCHTAVVELLLKAGANRQIMNKEGRTALQELGSGRELGTEAKNAIFNTFQKNYDLVGAP